MTSLVCCHLATAVPTNGPHFRDVQSMAPNSSNCLMTLTVYYFNLRAKLCHLSLLSLFLKEVGLCDPSVVCLCTPPINF
jgi:hypothetical protein